MVKNTGGCKAKGFARKHQTSHMHKLRMSECEQEKYAVVRKLFGTCCDVLCDDNIQRLAMIPGKFKGRNKRNNIISIGTVILIGTRDWASEIKGKLDKCDVLEVYSAQEVDQLKQRPSFPTKILTDAILDTSSAVSSKDVATDVVFSSIEELTSLDSAINDNEVVMETGEIISIDDI